MSRFRGVNSLSKNFRDVKTPVTAEDSIFSFLFKDLRDELKGIRECYEKQDENFAMVANQIAMAERARQEDHRSMCQNLDKMRLGLYILCVGYSFFFVDTVIGWKEIAFFFLRQMKHEFPVLKKEKRE